MNYMRVITLSRVFLVVSAVAVPAHAADVSVNCSARKNNSINAALAILIKGGPNTVRVSGICNEAVAISGFDRLTLIGNPTATINDPTPNQGSDEDTSVVSIFDSDRVVVQGITVNGGAEGIGCTGFSVCRLQDVHVQGSLGNGVNFARSSGFVVDNTVIENNAENGLAVVNGSNVSLFPSTDTAPVPIIRDNTGGGVSVNDDSHFSLIGTVRDNGGDGIVADRSANLRLIGATVTGNGGRGLFLRASTARIQTTSITGNTGNGIEVANLSLARIQGGNTVAGNGTWDVNCSSATAVTLGILNLIGADTNCVEPAP